MATLKIRTATTETLEAHRGLTETKVSISHNKIKELNNGLKLPQKDG